MAAAALAMNAAPQENPVKNKWLAGLLLAFCCWHAGFLIYSVVPASPSADPRGNPLLDFYQTVICGQQRWTVFDTIPVLHAFSAHFEREDEAGHKVTAGCVLPGFRAYPEPEESRYYVAYCRMATYANSVSYREAYLRKAAQLLPRPQTPGAGHDWSLVFDADYTRSLVRIKRDGLVSLRDTKVFEVDNPLPGENR